MTRLDELTRLHQAADAAREAHAQLKYLDRIGPAYQQSAHSFFDAVQRRTNATIDLQEAFEAWQHDKTEATWLALVAAWHAVEE